MIPNDLVSRTQTITVDPPYRDDDGTHWLLLRSSNPDVAWEIARNTGEAGDIGTTGNYFVRLPSPTGSCTDIFFYFGGNPWAGFSATLFGSSGPAGSCCAVDFGACQDGVLFADCDDPVAQSWNASPCSERLDCVPCNIPTCEPNVDPDNLENEPDCFTNYSD